MRRQKHVVKAAYQGLVLGQILVLVDAGQFFQPGTLVQPVQNLQAGLGGPAQKQRRGHMAFGPLHYLLYLVPVDHIAEVGQPQRRAGDDKTIVKLILHLFEIVVEMFQVRLRRILRRPVVDTQQVHANLQRRIGQHAQQLVFGFNFLRHQIKQQHPHRADFLIDRPGLRHHEDIFLSQDMGRWQAIRNSDGHLLTPCTASVRKSRHLEIYNKAAALVILDVCHPPKIR